MRISYWSADVCSSDLLRRHAFVCLGYAAPIAPLPPAHRQDPPLQMAFQKSQADRWRSDREDREGGNVPTGAISGPPSAILALGQTRSEEHTSELQSLMRISYAVFCLKKKKNTLNTKQKHNT